MDAFVLSSYVAYIACWWNPAQKGVETLMVSRSTDALPLHSKNLQNYDMGIQLG